MTEEIKAMFVIGLTEVMVLYRYKNAEDKDRVMVKEQFIWWAICLMVLWFIN